MVKGLETFILYTGVNHLLKTYTIARTVGDKCKTIVSTRRICVFIVLRISPVEMQRTITKLYQKFRCLEYDEERASHATCLQMCANTQVPLTYAKPKRGKVVSKL